MYGELVGWRSAFNHAFKKDELEVTEIYSYFAFCFDR